jgi:hypothetical protein
MRVYSVALMDSAFGGDMKQVYKAVAAAYRIK